MTGFDTFQSRMQVTADLVLQTPLRIGTGNSSEATDPDQPVLKDVLGRPVIPGASLKGALRSYLESILRAAQINSGRNLVCDLLQFASNRDAGSEYADKDQNKDDHSCIIHYAKSFDPEKKVKDIADEEIIQNTCVMCRLFGSPYVASRIYCSDLSVDENTWSGRYMIRDGVAIDRDTNTAADKRKYDFEVVPSGTRFKLRLQVDNGDPTDIGFVLLLIHALETQQILIGGARSRGLGWCTLENTNLQYEKDPVAYLLQPSGGLPQLSQATADDFKQAAISMMRGQG